MDIDRSSLRRYEVLLDESNNLGEAAGRGCHGAVYEARLDGAACVVKKVHDVLTGKGYHPRVSDQEWKALVVKFIKEIHLLSNQKHPNIVQFLGVTGLGGDIRGISLVMEKMEMSLNEFVKTNKGSIPLSVKLSILKDTASGVSHLHSKKIVHRDLHAGNVLLIPSLQAKVADLGVSQVVDQHYDSQQSLTMAPGASDYMPPEALRPKPEYGPKLDCFSFGHLSLYLINEIYPQVYELRVSEIVAQEGYQVSKRITWIEMLGDNHPLYQLIRTCLCDKPDHRWEMKKVREEIESIMLKNKHSPPCVKDMVKEIQKKDLNQSEQEQEITKLSEELRMMEDDLEVARSQCAIFEEDLKLTLEDLQQARDSNTRLREQNRNNQQIISALEKGNKSLERMRSSEQIEEIKASKQQATKSEEELKKTLEDWGKAKNSNTQLQKENKTKQLIIAALKEEKSVTGRSHEQIKEKLEEHVKSLKDEFESAKSQAAVFEEELMKMLKEEKQSKKEKKKESIQQAIAHKKLVDSLNDQLSKAKGKQNTLQRELDRKESLETSHCDLMTECHHLSVENRTLKEELEKLKTEKAKK